MHVILTNLFRRTSQTYAKSHGKTEKPKRPRFMQKNGHCNIRQAAQDKREKYMSDFFTTFVDLDWLYSVGLVRIYIFIYQVKKIKKKTVQKNCFLIF